MQFITDQYRELNEQLHVSNELYGISGAKYAGMVQDLCQTFNTTDVLDYGCGKSTLALNLPFAIKQYDPAVAKYATLPSPVNVVVCTDVLEHVEPEFIENVLDHLQELTKTVCIVVVATRPAKKTLSDGRNAHLIQKPAKWWLDKLWDRFDIINFNVEGGEFVAVLVCKTINIGRQNETCQ